MASVSSLPTGRAGQALALALAVVAGAAAWQAVGAPLLELYADRAANLLQRQALAARMAQVAGALPALRRTSTNPAPRPSAAPLLGGSSDAIAGAALQQLIQEMAAQSGATLNSAETLAAEPAGTFRRISVRVALSAPWPGLLRVLQAVTDTQPGLLIDDLQLHGGRMAGMGSDNPIDASLTVSGFRAGDDGA